MPGKIGEAIEILKEEYKIYQEICDTAKRKQEAVIEEDIELLEEVVRSEVECVEKIEELEERRKELVGDKEISTLQEEVDDKKSDQLEELKNKLSYIVQEVQDLNRTNEKLVKDSLQLVDLELKTLTGEAKTPTYGEQGKMDKGDNSAVINHKA